MWANLNKKRSIADPFNSLITGTSSTNRKRIRKCINMYIYTSALRFLFFICSDKYLEKPLCIFTSFGSIKQEDSGYTIEKDINLLAFLPNLSHDNFKGIPEQLKVECVIKLKTDC